MRRRFQLLVRIHPDGMAILHMFNHRRGPVLIESWESQWERQGVPALGVQEGLRRLREFLEERDWPEPVWTWDEFGIWGAVDHSGSRSGVHVERQRLEMPRG